jgi:hypothetical protein
MAGTGAAFVAEGAEHGVDPAFLVAVAGAESSFGLYLYASGGDQATYNAFNWFYAPTWPGADFATWEEAIAALAAGIAGHLYYGSGLYSVDAIGPRYCPDGTAAWLANVTLFMERLGGDPLDTRWTGSGPPAAGTPVLALKDGVQVSAAPYVVGESVEVRFSVVNAARAARGGGAGRRAGRAAAGAPHDLFVEGVLALEPGEEREFSGSWILGSRGRWHGWVELRVDGQRVLLESARAFALRARLPRDPELHRWVLTELALNQHP